MSVELRITRVRFYESTVKDGDFETDSIEHEDYEGLDLEEAITHLRNEGLTFAGNDWASDPDGSRIVHYAVGLREQTSAHVYNAYDYELAAIVAGADTPFAPGLNGTLPEDWTA